MYHTHWGLQTSPFGNNAVAAAEGSETCAEALARLQFLVDQRGQVGLLIGAAGTGKTSLLRRFCEVSRRRGLVAALISGKGCDERGLLQQLSRGWQLPALHRAQEPANETKIWELIANRLAELRYEQTACIVALDDADCAGAVVRCQVDRLLHCATTEQAQLTVVLSCTRETAGAIGAAWLARTELRIDLSPWSEDETAQHVAQRLLKSGSEEPIFTDEAITLLHELSGGVPRKVEQIAQLALLAGAGQQLSEIDAVTLAEAYQELGVGGL